MALCDVVSESLFEETAVGESRVSVLSVRIINELAKWLIVG